MKLSVSTAVGLSLCLLLSNGSANAGENRLSDETIAGQRAALAEMANEAGFGPQAPRDIESVAGSNPVAFGKAPPVDQMNLCNIHFHEGAEHKGGEYTRHAGNPDEHGYGGGYLYDGQLSSAELAAIDYPVGEGKHGDLQPGDTIEIHYVHSTAPITPGPTLGSCLSEANANPQLRVEAFVYVLVNDDKAADLRVLNEVGVVDGNHQAINMPSDLGQPVSYAGSTTGPGYNTKASPFQVTWNVHPKVLKVSISSVAAWLADNPFDEDHAHGVRNLVVNPDLLSPIN
ncbi:delta-class carbonic anhydrase [Roseibium sediminis]|uniref:delta-class carbonic anhydrase n=1 Tax=Roseibium sediminis TaxID=1775174 RepID=UPI001FCA99BA|nr:delta-class carbonic anhydrase [Roseibium sediminis]